jgi:alpha-galactosidase
MPSLFRVTFAVLFFLSSPLLSTPLNAVMGQNAAMGWNSWNRFHCNINETLIKETADAMVNSGMKAAGYEYVNLDDCWQTSRDENGEIVADPVRFPSGIKALADYVHTRGLKLGLYTDAGSATCEGRPGSLHHEWQDAKTYANWGVDYVKEDWCFSTGLDPKTQYTLMSKALRATGRDIVLSLCSWGNGDPWEWAENIAQLWRTTGDIADNWASVLKNIDRNNDLAAMTGPGYRNDPDMLEIGNGGLSSVEEKSHMGLWAISAAPLIAGNDIRHVNLDSLQILTHPEVIAVNQDPLNIQGTIVKDSPQGAQVWAKPLKADGSRAVLLLNRAEVPLPISIHWSELGLAEGLAHIRDVWNRQDSGMEKSLSRELAPRDSALFIVNGTEGLFPSGKISLSEFPWRYAASGWGPIERDRSNGERLPNDGRPLSVKGIKYAKGLGVHAPSRIQYYLGGKCSIFSTQFGIDDEVGTKGIVRFEVWADGKKLFDSGLVYQGTPTKKISVSLSGKNELTLLVRGSGHTSQYGHADWLNPILECTN